MKTVAAIVTYNRKQELTTLLTKLDSIEELKEAIVIDNNSDYIVSDWVESLTLPNLKINVVRLSENTGGAGGFATAFEHCLQTDFDYVWAMDDDGFPEVDCLKNMLLHGTGLDVVGPVVTDINDDNVLSFTLRVNNRVYDKRSNLPKESDVIENILNPFNGTLIRREALVEIGVPDTRYFIWGDEVEWLMRLKKSELKFGVLTSAMFRHPLNRVTLGGSKFFWCLNNTPLRVYCFYRNQINMRFRHNSKAKASLWLVRAFLSILLFSESKRISISAMYDGLRNKWGKHKRYLQ